MALIWNKNTYGLHIRESVDDDQHRFEHVKLLNEPNSSRAYAIWSMFVCVGRWLSTNFAIRLYVLLRVDIKKAHPPQCIQFLPGVFPIRHFYLMVSINLDAVDVIVVISAIAAYSYYVEKPRLLFPICLL